MKPKKFKEIKEGYDNFYRELMKKGKLPMRSTELGFWNAAISHEVYEAFRKLGLEKYKSFIDLGSGDGKITLIASLFCREAHGVEIDPELFEKSVEMASKLNIQNTSFHNKDLYDHDISRHDIVFVNPDRPMERGMEKKLLDELNGKLILYGNHFHPSTLKKLSNESEKGLEKPKAFIKEKSVLVDSTLVTLYSRK